MTAAAMFCKEINKLDLYEIELSAMKPDEFDPDDVYGGYLVPDEKYSEEEYNARGIRAEYHWYHEDEYWLPDGTLTDERGAYKYMRLSD